MNRYLLALLPIFPWISSCGVADGFALIGQQKTESYVYVGNYSSSTVSVFRLEDGTLSRAATTTATGGGTSNPNFLTSRSGLPFLLSANFISGNISVYSISDLQSEYAGALSAISPTFAYSTGAGASGIAIHPTSNYVYVPNYNQAGNNVSIRSIDSSSGAISTVGARPAGVNPAMAVIDPSGSYLYVSNFGSNNVTAFSISSSTGDLTLVGTYAAAAGSRSLVMDPQGRFLHVLNETAGSISGFTINSSTGQLTATTPATFTPGGTGPVRMVGNPTGTFLFVSNNTSNNISVLSVNSSTGNLTAVSGSPFSYGSNTQPYGLAVEPTTGSALAVAFAGEKILGLFTIDSSTGSLTSTGQSVDVGDAPRTVHFHTITGVE
ncbi:MAG: beta-propeller fold lactonase family protein [Bdellovibrionales bacterium]|nr:beta-propeller fold lactonase family protein [Bdellovibrionales bacterium]